jgi:hypothetical protein
LALSRGIPCISLSSDWQGALTWHRILDAIERLQAKAPAEGEKVH